MAKSKIMIDNNRTRVTEWSFEIGDETGKHIHEYDYVVVPMSDGVLKIINHDGEEVISKLTKGGSYYRNKGVNHNVINNNNFPYSFIEIEFK
jgi:quercetin dioxygenase-like cupin family protein